MAGILELNTLLKSMNPELKQGEYFVVKQAALPTTFI